MGYDATDATVLIEGDTGTGKELVARAIHRASDRADRPLIAINCTAIAAGVLDSELFGHAKGAFTSAGTDKKGLFATADQGTLFLDEVGDLPLPLQAKLLRAVESHDLVVGSRYLRGVNVVNWPMSRLLLSYAANKYARWVTGLRLTDSTAGFKCFRRSVLEAIDLNKVRSNGYAFQIEIKYRCVKKGFSVEEMPIVFPDRTRGVSKMSANIMGEAMLQVLKLRFLGR